MRKLFLLCLLLPFCLLSRGEEKKEFTVLQWNIWQEGTKVPGGYDAIVSDDSDGISAGQKQLLSISRIILSQPHMLILDEATSSIDTRTEMMIQEAFMRLMEGRTSFIVAHRLSTIRNADVILVVKEGDVIESGSHDELMARKGFYADMYMSQFRT